jgi:hypothetical protein
VLELAPAAIDPNELERMIAERGLQDRWRSAIGGAGR